LTNYDLDEVAIKRADAADFQQIASTVAKFHDFSRITDRTGRGDVCVVAYKHGALAHVRWAAVTPIPALGGRTMHLDSHEAYMFDSYTVPAFRRQGIASEARAFLMTFLAQQGIRCMYTDSRLDNIHTQQRWIERIREGRQRLLGVITVTTQLGWTYCSFSAETAATRPLIARLYHVPLQRVHIRSILHLSEKKN
jgi:GNAT superfamily N-acetyltransferase